MSGDYLWSTAESPKKAELRGVESDGDAVFASGKRGVLIERAAPGEWEAVFTTGATGDGRGVLDLSLTDDGERVWFSGYSGTFGYYDRANGSIKPHAGPYDVTANFQSVSVNGQAGSEEIHAVDGAGQVLRATVDGETLQVKGVSVPGDGTGFTEVVDHDDALYAADRAGFVYRSEDGRSWRRKRLADTSIKALSRTESGLVAIDDGGTMYKNIALFGEGGQTKKADPGIDAPQELEGLDGTIVGVGDSLVGVDENGRATNESVGTDKTLYAAEILDDGTVIAAGGDGVIVEGTPK